MTSTAGSGPAGVFVVSAVVVRGADERILTVRKRGTAAFMLPGGKIEAGETPHAAALRELQEEVGLRLGDLAPLRRYDAPAANEPGWRIDAWVFVGDLLVDGDAAPPAAAAEIAELRWADPWRLDEWPAGEVAPLLRDVLPDLTTYDVTSGPADPHGARSGQVPLDLAAALRPTTHRQGRSHRVRVARGEEAGAVEALVARYGRRRVRVVADDDAGVEVDDVGSGTSSTSDRST